MDYGFVPPSGQDGYLLGLRALLRECRKNTDLVTEHAEVPTVRRFIEHVGGTGIPKPIGDLVIGAHSRVVSSMLLKVALDVEDSAFPWQQASSFTTPDELQKAIASPTHYLRLPPGAARGDSVLWILTCSAGLDRTFLELFKEAVGIPSVRAPAAFYYYVKPVPSGVFEFIARGYTISRVPASAKEWADRPFKKYSELVQAFAEANFKLIDGNPVPASKWRSWIDRHAARGFASLEYPTTVELGETVAGLTELNDVSIHFVPFRDGFSAEVPVRGPIPASYTACRKLLHDYLVTQPDFQPGHYYPQYRWRGFLGVEEFVRGFYWKFTPTRPGGRNVLQCLGRRFVYTVAPPLTSPSTEKTLLFNFYPRKNLGLQPIIRLPYSNSNYFTTVGL